MLAKINRIMGKVVIPLNVINIAVGLVIGIAHVYLPFTSLFGLLMGVVLAISGSVSIGISYWFTAKNSQRHNAVTNQEERPPLKSTRASNIFLAIALPTMLLNTAGSFFGMYTGTLLLVAALGFAISPPAVIAIALALSTIFSVGTLINSWLQTHCIWEALKQPAATPRQAPQASFRPLCLEKAHFAPPGLRYRRDPEKTLYGENRSAFHARGRVVLSENVPRDDANLPLSYPMRHPLLPSPGHI